jgi:acetate kinase
MNILVLNPGSSSLKFQLFDARPDQPMIVALKGVVDRIGSSEPALRMSVGTLGAADASKIRTIDDAAELIFGSLSHDSFDAIGYRVVHGGDVFDGPARVTPDVLGKIKALRELAPLHNAAAMQCIEAGLRLRRQTAAVAVFDTSFHRTMPDVARRYAIPLDLADKNHLYHFGFHGISHAFVSRELRRRMKESNKTGSRLITCHLGNGSSLCAIRDGKSIDTSMGLTPLEGLIMGTRSGDIDAGLVLHLMRVMKMSADEIDDLLNHRGGLLGLSKRSGDTRDLEQAASAGDKLADAALEAFAYRCRKYLGAYAAALGGVDGIAFAGGIGEHSPSMRARIARGLEFLGVCLDETANRQASGKSCASIGTGGVSVWIIPADEERQIAEEVIKLAPQASG